MNSDYPLPSESTAQMAGLVYICLDYLCKGCRDLLSFWLHRAATCCSLLLGLGCLLASGWLKVVFPDATKLLCFSEAAALSVEVGRRQSHLQVPFSVCPEVAELK